MLSYIEHEKSFISWGPGLNKPYDSEIRMDNKERKEKRIKALLSLMHCGCMYQ